jgi:hypothetical protein
VRGATVCRSHGGAAPQVRAAAARREAEAQVRRGLARLDVAPIDDPLGELAKLAGQVVAWKDALAVKVNELTTGTCPECGPAEADAPLRYEAHGAGTEQLRAEVALFERALDRCASVLGLIAKLGIDERMARISELQAAAVVKAVDAGLAHLASQVPIPAEVAAETRGVVARHLRVVAS